MTVGAIFWGCNAPANFYWTGGAFLRQDWFFFLVASVALARKRKLGLAGAALTWSTLLRVFPLIFFGGPLILMAIYVMRRWRGQLPATDSRGRVLTVPQGLARWHPMYWLHPDHRKFLFGCIVAGGILVILLAGRVYLPRRWHLWLVAAALHGVIIFLINWLEPLQRYDATQATMLGIQLPAITALLVLLAVWQIVRALRGIGTIRNRLLVSFVAVVLLPVIAMGLGVGLIGLPNIQQQLLDHLNSVAILPPNRS